MKLSIAIKQKKKKKKKTTAMCQLDSAFCTDLELSDLYHCQLMKNFSFPGWPVKYSSTVLSSQMESVS